MEKVKKFQKNKKKNLTILFYLVDYCTEKMI